MPDYPENTVCEVCGASVETASMREHHYICPACGGYNRMPARRRIEMLTERGSFRELYGIGVFSDPIGFPDYPAKYEKARKKSGETEGVVCGRGKIGGHDTCLFVMEPGFMLGSMGTVVGDRITALFEYAALRKLPVVGYTVSGGARMQEGILSLMQMAKVSMAVKKHSDGGLFYLVCATDPTMGGVTASFAMEGDVIIAEPGAQIGFAGKRVIEQNTGQTLPDDFQSAEFQLHSGFVDGIVPREEQKTYIARMLSYHERWKPIG